MVACLVCWFVVLDSWLPGWHGCVAGFIGLMDWLAWLAWSAWFVDSLAACC